MSEKCHHLFCTIRGNKLFSAFAVLHFEIRHKGTFLYLWFRAVVSAQNYSDSFTPYSVGDLFSRTPFRLLSEETCHCAKTNHFKSPVPEWVTVVCM